MNMDRLRHFATEYGSIVKLTDTDWLLAKAGWVRMTHAYQNRFGEIFCHVRITKKGTEALCPN